MVEEGSSRLSRRNCTVIAGLRPRQKRLWDAVSPVRRGAAVRNCLTAGTIRLLQVPL
jgi:hypothetical protein